MDLNRNIRRYFSVSDVIFLKKGDASKKKTLSSVLKQALTKTKMNKLVSLHWLCQSYATHLLENGTYIRYVQEKLGHSSSIAPEIYTHVNTKSIQNTIFPFDYL